MPFDSVLNLAWLALGLIAVASTIHISFARHIGQRRRAPWLHVVGVALILTALFPYVSATDDVVQIEHFGASTGHGHTHSQTRNKNESLIRLYETMDSPLIYDVCRLTIVLFFFSIVFAPAFRVEERITPLRAGRSPPSIATA